MKVDLEDLKFQMAVLDDAPTTEQWKLCNAMVNEVVAHDIAIFRTDFFIHDQSHDHIVACGK